MNKIVLIIAGLAVGSLSTAAFADEALAKKSGCTACHALDKKLVGPSWKDIAAKYKGKADAPATLIAKVKNGGAGAFGSMPMPPQKGKVSDADIKALVDWSLAQ